jgi:hypothetical protein
LVKEVDGFLLGFKGRKGATITNFILIIGIIFVSVAALGVLRRLALSQATQVETDYTVSIAEQLKSAIEKAASYPSSAEYTLTLNDPLLYKANISGNKILFTFKKNNITKISYFFSASSSVIPSLFENSGIIRIYKKDNYIYVTDKLVCNVNDDICDSGCIALGLCDPACTTADPSNVCNPYCLDTNRNGRIDSADSDINCTSSCYRNYKKGFYDIDCVESGDGICDPDTSNVKDGVCDSDCLGLNGVCDPDCNAFDLDCPSKGNGICEPNRGESCLDYPEFPDCNCTSEKMCKAGCSALASLSLLDTAGCIDKTKLSSTGQSCSEDCQCNSESLICDTLFGTNKCCPEGSYFKAGSGCIDYMKDNQCNTDAPYSENCENSKSDCQCSALGFGECCLTCTGDKTEEGCCAAGTIKCNGNCKKVNNPLTANGLTCECSGECASNFCAINKNNPAQKACCPSGTEWDGAACKESCSLTLLFIKLDDISNFETIAKSGRDTWASLSPFKTCSEQVCYIFEDNVCSISLTDRKNGNALNLIRACANSRGYAGKYQRLIGVVAGNCVYTYVNLLGETICVGGYTKINYDVIIAPSARINGVCSHEMGHTFGLCDEGYGSGTCSSCPTGWNSFGGSECYGNCYVRPGETLYCCPNIPEQNSLMCSMDSCGYGCTEGSTFSSSSYTYLETRINQYCG